MVLATSHESVRRDGEGRDAGNPGIDAPTTFRHWRLGIEQQWVGRAVEVERAHQKREQECRDLGSNLRRRSA